MAIVRNSSKKVITSPKKLTNISLKSKMHEELDKWVIKIKKSR